MKDILFELFWYIEYIDNLLIIPIDIVPVFRYYFGIKFLEYFISLLL